MTTLNGWLEKCETPKGIIEAFGDVKTMDDSISLRTPQMSLIKRERGKDYARGYFKLWIVYLQGNINIKTKLSDDMVDLAAQTLLDEFWYCTLSDAKVIFSDALMGRYGEFYESLSIPKIVSWFDSYFKIKFDKMEYSNASDHNYLKNEEMGWRKRTKNLLTDHELNEIDKWMKNS